MNYIEQEFYNNDYVSVDIWYEDEIIDSISLYDERFIGNKASKTYIDYLDIRGTQVSLTIDLAGSSIVIVIEDENIDGHVDVDFNLNNFEFILNTYEEEIDDVSFNIPLYMPTLTYTNLMSSITYDIESPNIVPLIDVDSVERLEKYKEDEILIFRHFLDLEYMDEIVNHQEIEEAKEQRKKERKLLGSGNQVTLLPNKQRERLKNSEIIQKYKDMSNKELIIPVLNWDRGQEVISDINELLKSYSEVAIRVSSSFSSFHEATDAMMEGLIEGVSSDNIHIILDLSNNFALSQYIDTVKNMNY